MKQATDVLTIGREIADSIVDNPNKPNLSMREIALQGFLQGWLAKAAQERESKMRIKMKRRQR